MYDGKEVILQDGNTKNYNYSVTEENGVYIAKINIDERTQNVYNSALNYPMEQVVIIDTNNITALSVLTHHCYDVNNNSKKWDTFEVTYYDGKTRMAMCKQIGYGAKV